MTEDYKSQFEDNSDWLKMSFHSKEENFRPYENAGYDGVKGDMTAVNNEIIRFAGSGSLATTTTVHYCLLTDGGLKAVKDCGIKGLLGLFGDEENERSSYGLGRGFAEEMRKGRIKCEKGISYSGIDVILNLYDENGINGKLKKIIGRDFIKIMIHEQYFYKDYFNYQPDFAEKTESAIKLLIEKGYKSVFYEELI
ncbi:MAG: hypothetical protein IJS67_05465 [Clostridia bacterium]|nr:hypothetical protein [Clostridia bacterium]